MRWKITDNGELPEKNKYTDVIVALTNGDMEWVAADRYDGYSETFENNHCKSGVVKVYKWMKLPDVPPI